MRARLLLPLVALLASVSSHALYDPAPDASLAAVEGEWSGTLTYRDYSPPHGLVTLPTRLFVALRSDDELVLHYVYDDGPAKTVHSYEALRFEWAARQVTSSSGRGGDASVGRIVQDVREPGGRRIVVETTDAEGRQRHTFEFAQGRLVMAKDEIDAQGVATRRNAYEFRRP